MKAKNFTRRKRYNTHIARDIAKVGIRKTDRRDRVLLDSASIKSMIRNKIQMRNVEERREI